MDTQNRTLTPNKWSFIVFQSGIPALFLLAIIISIPLVLALIFGEGMGMIVGGVFWVLALILALSFAWTIIRYRKEKYVFEDTKIIYHSGTLFSDNTTEVRMEKITEVALVLPFVQHLLFKTGHISIKTAGSATSKVTLRNINSPEALYEEMQVRMRQNGYHLSKDKLVQEARPHILGVFGEMFNRAFGTILVILYFFWPLFAGNQFSDIIEGGSSGLEALGGVLSTLFGIIFWLGILVYVAIVFLDLRRRKYDVYTDSIFYTEGFLTKHYAFLPMERVADIENRQSFFSRILGLHDIVISSEGTNNTVVFANMTDGEQMIKNIKYLKNQITMQEPTHTVASVSADGTPQVVEDVVGYKDQLAEPLVYDHDFRAEYRMDARKTFLGTTLLVISAVVVGIFFDFSVIAGLIGFILVFSVSTIIQFAFTRYIVDSSTIERKFSFLSNKHSSFTVDKISGIVIKESILDRILGTCSITFWSIGSGSNITFSNIRKTPDLENNILKKVGIYRDGAESESIPVSFGLLEYIKNHIKWLLIFGIIIAFILGGMSLIENLASSDIDVREGFAVIKTGIIWVIVGLIVLDVLYFLYQMLYYSKNWYRQSLYLTFVESISGIFFKQKKYSLYRHIKGLSATKNPLTNTGTIVMSVAGQVSNATESGKKYKSFTFENSIKMDYVAEIFSLLDKLDTILKNAPLDTTVVSSSRQDVGNSLIFPVIVLVLITLSATMVDMMLAITVGLIGAVLVGLIYWYISTKLYQLEKDRIISEYGIIYRTREAILYKKFNFIEKHQGFLGKVFKNGTIHVYTLGSATKDMTLADVDKFTEVYDLLKRD